MTNEDTDLFEPQLLALLPFEAAAKRVTYANFPFKWKDATVEQRQLIAATIKAFVSDIENLELFADHCKIHDVSGDILRAIARAYGIPF